MNIGVSIYATAGAHIWSSGLNQNLAFLLMLLRRCRGVEDIYLLNGGDGHDLPAGMAGAVQGFPLLRPEDVTHRVDVVIEMGAKLPVEWMRHVRAMGVKLVLFLCGHPYTAIAESCVFERAAGVSFVEPAWNEIWTLPEYMHSSASLLRLMARAPVFEMPHLWSPLFLDESIAALGPQARPFGLDLDRRRRHAGWRVGIFEPNISVVKNCTIPMLACDEAYRRDRESIEHMMVLNSVHMKDHPTFFSLAANLDLTRASRASFEPRVAFGECMAQHSLDAVVSHHWENGQNYLYYDALHGGYPLVHNSEFLAKDGVGLYYPEFSAKSAAAAIVRARMAEPGFWQDYAGQAQAFLATLGPEHPDNIRAFEERLHA